MSAGAQRSWPPRRSSCAPWAPEVTRVAQEAPACVFASRDAIEASDAEWNIVELMGASAEDAEGFEA